MVRLCRPQGTLPLISPPIGLLRIYTMVKLPAMSLPVSGSYSRQANYLLGAKFQHQLACTSFQTPWSICLIRPLTVLSALFLLNFLGTIRSVQSSLSLFFGCFFHCSKRSTYLIYRHLSPLLSKGRESLGKIHAK